MAITTNEDSRGAKAGQKNFLWACSTPVNTTDMPYNGIWTANTLRNRVNSSCWACALLPTGAGNNVAIAGAPKAINAPIGISRTRQAVSKEDAIRSMSAFIAFASGAASSGIVIPASAPPAATS